MKTGIFFPESDQKTIQDKDEMIHHVVEIHKTVVIMIPANICHAFSILESLILC